MIQIWYAVSTKPKKENLVSLQLEKDKIEVFLPKVKERINRFGRPVTLSTPLFPGYLFVNVENNLTVLNKIRWTIGVKKIMGNGDIPVSIDENVILFIKSQTTKDGVIRIRNRFKPGERVRIKTGLMKDLIGIIKEPAPREGRIKVLMNIIKYSAEVEIDESVLIKD
ncbi:MAG: transcription termination/antitermination protein NusG [Nitrospirota bacterium]